MTCEKKAKRNIIISWSLIECHNHSDVITTRIRKLPNCVWRPHICRKHKHDWCDSTLSLIHFICFKWRARYKPMPLSHICLWWPVASTYGWISTSRLWMSCMLSGPCHTHSSASCSEGLFSQSNTQQQQIIWLNGASKAISLPCIVAVIVSHSCCCYFVPCPQLVADKQLTNAIEVMKEISISSSSKIPAQVFRNSIWVGAGMCLIMDEWRQAKNQQK